MKTLYELVDDQYPNNGYNHVRKVVRAIVFDEDMQHIALHYLHATDEFGYRDYYETPGGGVRKHESLKNALKRELKEELGVNVKIIEQIGKVIDYYNLINRKNINYYYICQVTSRGEKALEDKEKSLIEKTVWVTTLAAIDLYENMQNVLVGKLVKQRELPIIKIVANKIK